jgi:hypothetical protein
MSSQPADIFPISPHASPSVTWDGLELNPLAEDANGVLAVVEDVTGWYDSPDYDGHDTALVLSDGSLAGPKTAAARTVTISGSVVGPAYSLALFRDQLIMRAAALLPADLTIPDKAGRYMTASVRCDSDGLKHTFAGPDLFTYQATLTAPDPRLYGYQTGVTLTNSAGATGWTYDSAKWHLPITGTPLAAAYNWVMNNVSFLPGAGPVSSYLFGTTDQPNRTGVPVTGNAGAGKINAGDIAIGIVTADRPVALRADDTQGNDWVPLISVDGTGLSHRIFVCDKAKALASADVVSFRGSVLANFAASIFGLHGTGGRLTTDTGYSGNTVNQFGAIDLAVPTGVILSVTSGQGAGNAPLDPAGWTGIEKFTAQSLNQTAAFTTATAPTWPMPGIARHYKRAYASKSLPNDADLFNNGNVAAPVLLTYNGDLGASRLVDNATGNTIYLAPVTLGAQVYLDTSTLNAWAPGGASRAGYVLPGSVPLLIPALGTASWSLYATGSGSLDLTWRSAWH